MLSTELTWFVEQPVGNTRSNVFHAAMARSDVCLRAAEDELVSKVLKFPVPLLSFGRCRFSCTKIKVHEEAADYGIVYGAKAYRFARGPVTLRANMKFDYPNLGGPAALASFQHLERLIGTGQPVAVAVFAEIGVHGITRQGGPYLVRERHACLRCQTSYRKAILVLILPLTN